MHTSPHSASPASFRIEASARDVADVFTDPHPQSTNPSRPTRRRRSLSRRPDCAEASLWWDTWVPVAATGWGALVVIAPLIAARFLIRLAGGRRDD